MTSSANYHKSVLVKQVLHYWHHKPGGVYVDATFGGGGHTQALLEHDPACSVIAFDWDARALELNAPALQKQFGDRLTTVWGNFAQLGSLLERHGVHAVDGILADFGTSQYQIVHAPGFSFSSDSPLDMRMSGAHTRLNAAQVLAHANEKQLADIFYLYGQERYARAIARAIVTRRSRQPITTTLDLANVVASVSRTKNMRIHPATRVFQALRIYVNRELENISSFLTSAYGVLADEGRLVCISFHSLEDRLVKQFFVAHADARKSGSKRYLQALTKKPIMADDDEVNANPSSRSARLRAACAYVGHEDCV